MLNVLSFTQAAQTLGRCCVARWLFSQSSSSSIRSFQSTEVVKFLAGAEKESKEHTVTLLPCLVKSLIVTAWRSEIGQGKIEEVRRYELVKVGIFGHTGSLWAGHHFGCLSCFWENNTGVRTVYKNLSYMMNIIG